MLSTTTLPTIPQETIQAISLGAQTLINELTSQYTWLSEIKTSLPEHRISKKINWYKCLPFNQYIETLNPDSQLALAINSENYKDVEYLYTMLILAYMLKDYTKKMENIKISTLLWGVFKYSVTAPFRGLSHKIGQWMGNNKNKGSSLPSTVLQFSGYLTFIKQVIPCCIELKTILLKPTTPFHNNLRHKLLMALKTLAAQDWGQFPTLPDRCVKLFSFLPAHEAKALIHLINDFLGWVSHPSKVMCDEQWMHPLLYVVYLTLSLIFSLQEERMLDDRYDKESFSELQRFFIYFLTSDEGEEKGESKDYSDEDLKKFHACIKLLEKYLKDYNCLCDALFEDLTPYLGEKIHREHVGTLIESSHMKELIDKEYKAQSHLSLCQKETMEQEIKSLKDEYSQWKANIALTTDGIKIFESLLLKLLKDLLDLDVEDQQIKREVISFVQEMPEDSNFPLIKMLKDGLQPNPNEQSARVRALTELFDIVLKCRIVVTKCLSDNQKEELLKAFEAMLRSIQHESAQPFLSQEESLKVFEEDINRAKCDVSTQRYKKHFLSFPFLHRPKKKSNALEEQEETTLKKIETSIKKHAAIHWEQLARLSNEMDEIPEFLLDVQKNIIIEISSMISMFEQRKIKKLLLRCPTCKLKSPIYIEEIKQKLHNLKQQHFYRLQQQQYKKQYKQPFEPFYKYMKQHFWNDTELKSSTMQESPVVKMLCGVKAVLTNYAVQKASTLAPPLPQLNLQQDDVSISSEVSSEYESDATLSELSTVHSPEQPIIEKTSVSTEKANDHTRSPDFVLIMVINMMIVWGVILLGSTWLIMQAVVLTVSAFFVGRVIVFCVENLRQNQSLAFWNQVLLCLLSLTLLCMMAVELWLTQWSLFSFIIIFNNVVKILWVILSMILLSLCLFSCVKSLCELNMTCTSKDESALESDQIKRLDTNINQKITLNNELGGFVPMQGLC